MEKEEFQRFVENISVIIRRPGMLSIRNVEDINLVILGYLLGILGKDNRLVLSFLSEFRDFLNSKWDDDFKKLGDYDWPRLIRFYSCGDSHSIELFKINFEHFVDIFKAKIV